MEFVFRPTTEEDAPRVISFLARVFSAPRDSEFLRPDLLRWKLWSPRDDYLGPRSYVVERRGEIVAHSGVWPIPLRTKTGTFQGCHMFDWASDPQLPGPGVVLIRRFHEMFDFLLAHGGSVMARKIIPAVGFKKIGEVWSAARPLRPLRQMLSHQCMNLKIPARFFRNTMWSLYPSATCTDGWTILESFDVTEVQPEPPNGRLCAFRSSAFLTYLRSCPAAQVRVFRIQKNGHNVGWFALSLVHHQMRVAGVWLDQPSARNLSAAYALVQQAARTTSAAFEIVATGSTTKSEQAAVSAGLKIRTHTPLYLLPRKTNFPPIPFEFQMSDNAGVFLSMGGASYWT
jgi:hypothetical protein